MSQKDRLPQEYDVNALLAGDQQFPDTDDELMEMFREETFAAQKALYDLLETSDCSPEVRKLVGATHRSLQAQIHLSFAALRKRISNPDDWNQPLEKYRS